MIPMICASVLRNFVAALGRPIFATAITGVALIASLIGNYAFVFGNLGAPALGLEGSALASVITALVQLFSYLIAIRLDRRLRRYRILGNWWRTEWSRMRELLRLGLPVMMIIIAEAGLFSGAAFLMGRIGEAELAGHTVALQIAALAFQIPFGIGQAATIRVGYHFGAQDHAAIGRAGWAGIAMGAAFMALTASAMLLAPGLLLRIYIDPTEARNAAMAGFAVRYMAVAAAFQLFERHPGGGGGRAAWLAGHPDAHGDRDFQLLGAWHRRRAVARLPHAAPGHRDLDRSGDRAGVRCRATHWRWRRREALGLVRPA